MILIYLLWLTGILFGLLFLTQMGLIAYKLYKKQDMIRNNIIFGIVFVMIAIACTSSAVFLGFEKVLQTPINYESIGNKIGETTAELTANTVESFIETWDQTVNKE